ncbi:ATP-binding protein [Candidatus Poribacteria bacterium]|nr:ATP-binding protein [Candidatus Poribacteria bacterium]
MSEKPTNTETLLLQLLEKVDNLLTRFQVETTQSSNDVLDDYIAFQWRQLNGNGNLNPIKHPHLVDPSDLIGVDTQLQTLDRNTRQFLNNTPANHVLLWGDRGTGKSSLVKSMLMRYADHGLRLISVGKEELIYLPDIAELVWERKEKFILFCDDLAFNEDDPAYRELKAMLEGGVSAQPDNLLIYATSNRRHLMPRQVNENKFPLDDEDELYPREATEEKVSLSDRFGLRLAFYRIPQNTYLKIVSHYAQKRGINISTSELHQAALEWEASSSGRSGRVAYQFITDLAGKLALRDNV